MDTDPLAYFITWTCYGTWLPGDNRGWLKWHSGEQLPQPRLSRWCIEQMTEEPVTLDGSQRMVVHNAIQSLCTVRDWHLLAVNCRSNHCHSVVCSSNHAGEQVRDQLKSWTTRALKEHQRGMGVHQDHLRNQWWTRNGSVRYVFDEASLESAIQYTLEAQDIGGSKGTKRQD